MAQAGHRAENPVNYRGGPGQDDRVESLADLRARRAIECRLVPDRALRSLGEAEAFLRDRGLLTRTTDCALPSLYEACHEDPYRPGRPGFATWPAAKWHWFGELAGRGYLATSVHRGKNLLVSSEVAALLDPVCRAEIERMRACDDGWRRLLDHLATVGPSSAGDLRTELGLKRQELKALRSPLERCGAIVSRPAEATTGTAGQHSSVLGRWDQAGLAGAGSGSGPGSGPGLGPGSGSGPGLGPGEALQDLVVAGVRAAVVAPEAEPRRWFSWQWYWTGTLIDDLVRAGRLRRVDGHLTVP